MATALDTAPKPAAAPREAARVGGAARHEPARVGGAARREAVAATSRRRGRWFA